MRYYLKILKESLILVILSSSIGLISGTVLSLNNKILYAIPIILLILPALNSLIGDMATVLVSRLSSSLYIGTIPPKIQFSKRIKNDFLGLISTLLLSFIVLIILGSFIGMATGIMSFNPITIFIIILMSILILFGILFIFLFISSILLFRKGLDPNNFLIPFVTSLADFLTPVFLIVFIIIFI